MPNSALYKIHFISESAATVDFGSVVDENINKKIIALFHYLYDHPLSGMTEAIPAYASLTVYFDLACLRKKISPGKKVFQWINDELHRLMKDEITSDEINSTLIRIPVCYNGEFGIDLKWMAEQKNISTNDIIQLHCAKQYRVFMLGFLPGFAYMGEVDEKIAIPRKPEPQSILAGSVGIAGKQTGIYPLNSPGGWQIIGRTPLKLFDKEKKELCLLKAGDFVEFYSITKDEFENY
jgi:inhibitor of KinA